MKIAVLAPAWFPVPPMRYGGIEWVVSILADGLVEQGHEVTLFAAGDSQTKARLVTSYDEPPQHAHRAVAARPAPRAQSATSTRPSSTSSTTTRGRWPQPWAPVVKTPVCHTIHGPMTGEAGNVYALIGEVCPRWA